jgi:hypothetical protein
MPFWRSWGAALLGASGVALLVPVGLLLVVVAAAGGSGATGFGKLGQVAAGPALPRGGGLSARDGARLPSLPRARPSSPGGTRGVPVGNVVAPSSRGPGPRAGRAPAARRPPTFSGATPSGSTSSGTGGSGTLPPPGTGTPTPTPTPTKPATRPLPAVVAGLQATIALVPIIGPPAADAVGSVAGLILPPGSRPPRTP